LINGQRIHYIVVDSGAEAVITSSTGAQAMGITPDMLTPNAVALKIADGQLTVRNS
jgi:predicted aspartyl protease